MIEKSKVDIEIDDKKIIFNLKDKKYLSKHDYKEINGVLKEKSMFYAPQKIEINFGEAYFEMTDLTERLIRKSKLLKNKELQIILNFEKYNLSNRLICLHYLKKFKIDRYRINYY